MYNKTIIRFGFVISRLIEVSVRVISLRLRLRLITPTSTLIILNITKTSSNNCLYYQLQKKSLLQKASIKTYTFSTFALFLQVLKAKGRLPYV